MEDNTRYRRIFKFMLVFGLAILTLAALMVLFGSSAQADIIVDQAGGGDFLTIQEGVDNAGVGENIFVWDGSYNENITIDKSIQLIGNGSATTIIDGFGTMNNIINITAEGVEITGFNITESGLWYSIWANVGGFYIHDNVFDTQNWAIYMDITRLNSGSITVGDIIVDNNEVIGTNGFHFNLEIEEPLSGSDFVFGKTVITNNTLYITQTGIDINRYAVLSMDQGSVTWDDIIVKDNFINSSNSGGIDFWGIFWNITDVNIDVGKINVSNNNITAQEAGIGIDWWDFCDGFYGNTIATTQDTQIYSNDIVSQSGSGIYLQTDIIGYILYDSTSVTTGDFYIYSNNITTTSTSLADGGICFQMTSIARYMYNDSSVNFGNIYIDSNNVDSSSRGIYFNIGNSFGSESYDNALVKIGDVSITNNEILSVNHGIYINFDGVGYIMYDNASATLGSYYINNNNITSSNGDGIRIETTGMASLMHNETSFSMGDFAIGSNTINSTNNDGIYLSLAGSAYDMSGTANATFGNFLISDNNIISDNGQGIDFRWDNVGYNMYDYAYVQLGEVHLERNEIEKTGGSGMAVFAETSYVGAYMYDNAFLTFGNWYVDNNNISTVSGGITTGPSYVGRYMYNNSEVIFGDYYVRDNTVTAGNDHGILIEYYECGEYLFGYPRLTGGNMTVTGNNASSMNQRGLSLIFDYNGIDMQDSAYASFGWVMVEHNNFSSVNENGVYLSLYDNGNNMKGNSQVYVSDFMITYNDVLSDTMDALRIYFYSNAWGMSNDSYMQMGNIQVNDNNLTAGGTGDGIELFQWQQNAYDMSHNASADFGNFEFNRNTITAGGGGIMMSSVGYWGNFLWGDNHVTIGHFFLNDNVITNLNGYGIFFGDWYDMGKQIYGQSVFTMGDIEITGNSISTIGTSGIYVYMDSWAWRVYDNAEVHFGNFLFNDNIVNSTGYGIDINSILYWGSDVHNNSLATFGNVEVNRNEIIAGSIPSGSNRGIYFLFYDNGYDMSGNSSVNLGHIQFNDNNITCYDSHGIYVNAYELAYTMTGTSSATFGDFSVSYNIIDSRNQGVYLQFDNAGYDMHDMSTFEMGSIIISNNTIISGQDPASVDSHGIFFQSQYVGYEMYNETQAIVGPILVNDNNITVLFGTNSHAIYINWISDYGANMYDTASFTMNGNIEVCRNTINTTNGEEGISCNVYNLGNYLYGDNTASYGDFLFNNNTIIEAYNDGIRIEVSEIGYYTNGNSLVTIGNVEINNNDILLFNGGYYAGIELYLDNLGASMYNGSIFSMGHVQMNDNIIYCMNGLGFEVSAYWLGYQLYNSSSAYFGDFQFLRNEITSKDWGIRIATFQNLATDLHNDTMVFFGNFLINNNLINTTGIMSDGISFNQPRYVGYQMYDQSHAELGYFEFNGNEIIVSSLSNGIDFQPDNWGSYMYDDTTFTIGDFNFIDNTITAGYNGIYFQPSYFGAYMYGNSTAIVGNNFITGNEIDVVDTSLYAWWWSGFGNWMYDYSYFEVGSCYIMFNNITSWSPTYYGIYTGPDYSGCNVYDESQAHFGDYIVSHNTVFSNGKYGIYLDYEGIGYYLDISGLSECRAVVEVGEIRLESNIITVPQGTGINVNGYDVAEDLNDFASVNTTGIFIVNNTITAFDCGIYFGMEYFGYNLWNESQANLGPAVIEKNNITSTNGTGIKYYIYDNAYYIYNDARLSIDDIHLKQNTITASTTGIDIVLKRCINLLDNSTVVFPGMLIADNVIDSAFSAFNYTTVEIPSGVTGTATLLVGDVIIQGNTFDGGLFGMFFEWQNPDPTVQQPVFRISYNDVLGGAVSSTGLYMMNITDTYIETLSIDGYDQGIYVNNSNIWYMFNSTISNIPSYDLNLSAGSFIGAVNTTFDNSSVYFEDDICLLNVGWFMNVYVQSQVFLPVPEANLTVKDVDGTDLFNGTCDLNGRAFYIICWEYQENITGIIKNFNDYTADANKGGSFGSAVPNPTMNQTRLVVITLLDLIPPMIFADNSDTAGTTGDPFYFEINASDNMGIVSVHVNYRLGGVGPFTNLTMSGIGPYWLNEIMPPDYVGFIEYYFTALDSGGFWVNTTPTTAPITDNDAPTIMSDNSDLLATTGDTFNFIVDATDNIDISEVHVVWWFGAGAPTNDTMIGTGPYTFSIPVPLSSLGQLHYYFTMTDLAGNWLVGPQVDVNVSDNDAPTYIWISRPTEGYTGDFVSVSIQATDNIDLTYYKIEIDGFFYDLIKDGDFYNFTINIPPDSVAPITYGIVLNDSANNPNFITPTQITVTDNDQPTYSWVLQPNSGTTGESVVVSILASDNIGIIYYKIEIDGVLYDMIKNGNYYNYTVDIPPDSVNPIIYSIILNDSADNPNIISPPIITVTDNDAPTFTWVSRPTAGVVGSTVLVSLTGYDNIGITNYTIYIDGVPFDMVKDGDYYNYTINIPPGIPVNITYNVTLRDAAGNPVTTGDTVIGVISVDDQAPQYSWNLHPTTGTTGDSVLVSLLATDNIGITYYKIEIDGTLYDLVKDGDYYNYTINIPSNSLASITYSVTFNDAADNPATTPDSTITVNDNDAPAYTWILHPSTGTAGGSVLVSLMASDNIGITYYKIDINGTLYDLIKDGNYFNYTINLPPGSSDSITYDITFKDAANNEISTGDTVITVTIPADTDPPQFTWVLHPEAGTTGDSLLVSVIATDNIGITYYKISVNGILYDLVKNGNYYNYTINIPTNSLAGITYFVVFNDSANNPKTATDTVITVIDNDPATISNPASDTSGKKGKEFTFQIDVSDNIGISEVRVWYWFGDDDSQKKALVLTEENGTYSGTIILEESGELHYYFEVTDYAGNTFQSDEYTVAIGAAEKEDEEEANVLPLIVIVIIIIIVLLLFLLTRKKKEAEEILEVEEGLAEGEEEVEEIEEEEVEGEEPEGGTEEEYKEEEIEGEEPEEEVELEEMEPGEELDQEEETEDREL